MTRAVIFSGSHARHLYVHQSIVDVFDEVLVFVMQREDPVPEVPKGLDRLDRMNFSRHFRERAEVERSAYGELTVAKSLGEVGYEIVTPLALNGPNVCERVASFHPDVAFIFGCDMIRHPLIDLLPDNKINLHLGLSPWYKGSATLFWPFYFLQPQFAGVTFHQLADGPDSGDIIHQSCPPLAEEDGIHDVSARCVLNAAKDARTLMKRLSYNDDLHGKVQRTSGRVWRRKDFHASHLRVIYNLFDNDIVAHFLSGKLGSDTPKLYSCL